MPRRGDGARECPEREIATSLRSFRFPPLVAMTAVRCGDRRSVRIASRTGLPAMTLRDDFTFLIRR